MNKVKTYYQFINEEINFDMLIGISVGASVLAIVSSMIRVGISTSNAINKSAEEIKEEALKDSTLKRIIVKINNDQKVIDYINLYKHRFSEMTYNEMKKFTEELKIILGDVLTTSEWKYCDDVIDKISKSDNKDDKDDIIDSDFFNKREMDLLNSEGFKPSNNQNSNFDIGIPFEKKFSNKELNIDITKNRHNFKIYSDEPGRDFRIENKVAFKYFYEENGEIDKGYIKKLFPGIPSTNKIKESQYFKSIQECLDHIKGIYEKNKSDELYDIIKLHQKLFRKSYRNEIISFISRINTKEEAIEIINDYNFKYDDSLVSTLRTMSDSGDFINHFRKLGLIRN